MLATTSGCAAMARDVDRASHPRAAVEPQFPGSPTLIRFPISLLLVVLLLLSPSTDSLLFLETCLGVFEMPYRTYIPQYLPDPLPEQPVGRRTRRRSARLAKVASEPTLGKGPCEVPLTRQRSASMPSVHVVEQAQPIMGQTVVEDDEVVDSVGVYRGSHAAWLTPKMSGIAGLYVLVFERLLSSLVVVVVVVAGLRHGRMRDDHPLAPHLVAVDLDAGLERLQPDGSRLVHRRR